MMNADPKHYESAPPTPADLPPHSKTGAEITSADIAHAGGEIGLDWLAFTVLDGDAATITGLLGSFVAGDYLAAEGGMSGYERMVVGPAGSRVLSTGRRSDVHVILPGAWCRALTQGDAVLLLQWVEAAAKPTRCDLALDDYKRIIMPAGVWEANSAGECISHTRKRRRLEDWETGAVTVEFGKRGSRQFLRVYDKAIQSGGAVVSVRWELETREEAAVSLVVALASGSWADTFCARLVQFVDFREVNDSNVTRRGRLGWYESLIGAAKRALVYGPTPVVSLTRTVAWLISSVAPLLAAVEQATVWQGGITRYLLENGPKRWKVTHRMLAGGGGVSPQWAALSGAGLAPGMG